MANRHQTVCLLLVLASVCLAFCFRIVDLDRKPLHTDEAVQGLKFTELLEENHYLYDPVEYHGPTLYYLTLPVAWIKGAAFAGDVDIFDLRLVTVLFGSGIVLLLLLMRDGLGNYATFAGALLLAISSPLVYYSRYYIQEILLVFFCMLMIGALWRAVQSKRKSWVVLAGLAAGMAHASKETCIISFAAMILAAGVAWWSMPKSDRPGLKQFAIERWQALGLFAVCAIGISVLFFSSFFSNAEGPLDSVRTYLNYFGKAHAETGHEKPMGYYLSLMIWHQPFPGYRWTELITLILFGVGCGSVVLKKALEGVRPFYVFLIVYGLFQFVIYSLLSYKTPWLMLSFIVPMLMVAGVGAVSIYSACKNVPARILVLALFAGAFVQMTSQSCKAAFELHSDWRNPYAYSQTVAKYTAMEERIYQLADFCQGKQTKIVVASKNYWPLPWTLRDFPEAGYFDQLPAELDAPIVIIDEDQFDAMEEGYSGAYIGQLYSLRPELPIYIYVQTETWLLFMEQRQ